MSTSSVPQPQLGSFPVGTDITLVFTMNPPLSVAGWNFLLSFYDSLGNLKFQKANGTGIVIVDSVNGVIDGAVLAADTTGYVPGNYQAALERSDFGFVTQLAIVNFLLTPLS